MTWRLISMAAALGLSIVIPAQAATHVQNSSASVQLADAHQNKGPHVQSNKPQTSVQQMKQRPQLKTRDIHPNVQRNLTIQNRNRVLQNRNLQDRNVVRTQRYDWKLYRPGHQPPNWNEHRQFDRSQWQRNFTARHRYRWRPYNRPRGWYYRRWVFGMILPSLFWTRDYWINDYWQFSLMNPPYGYVWVRYGDDALLVNVQTGTILRVVYGVFY